MILLKCMTVILMMVFAQEDDHPPGGCVLCTTDKGSDWHESACTKETSPDAIGEECQAGMNEHFWNKVQQAEGGDFPDWTKMIGWCGTSDKASVKNCTDWVTEKVNSMPPQGCYPCSTLQSDDDLYGICSSNISDKLAPIGKVCIEGTINKEAWKKHQDEDGPDIPEWKKELGWCGIADNKDSVKKCDTWSKKWAGVTSDASTLYSGLIALLSLIGAFILFV